MRKLILIAMMACGTLKAQDSTHLWNAGNYMRKSMDASIFGGISLVVGGAIYATADQQQDLKSLGVGLMALGGCLELWSISLKYEAASELRLAGQPTGLKMTLRF